MRTLVIGDIHGSLQALDAVLQEAAPAANDHLVLLGDYVDRGPDSCGTLDRLIELSASHTVTALRGNHDQLMLEARGEDPMGYVRWLGCGGRATLASYHPASLGAIPQAHWDFLANSCRNYYETDRWIFVHGYVEEHLPLDRQPVESLHWKRPDALRGHISGKMIVCGHTPQFHGLPTLTSHAVLMDTAVAMGGWLSCLHLESGDVWQADLAGRTRRVQLDFAPGCTAV